MPLLASSSKFDTESDFLKKTRWALEEASEEELNKLAELALLKKNALPSHQTDSIESDVIRKVELAVAEASEEDLEKIVALAVLRKTGMKLVSDG